MRPSTTSMELSTALTKWLSCSLSPRPKSRCSGKMDLGKPGEERGGVLMSATLQVMAASQPGDVCLLPLPHTLKSALQPQLLRYNHNDERNLTHSHTQSEGTIRF